MANGKAFIEEIKTMAESDKPLPTRQATQLLLVGLVDIYNIVSETKQLIETLEEKRIQPLEKWKSNMEGRLWALLIGIPVVVSILGWVVNHLLGG